MGPSRVRTGTSGLFTFVPLPGILSIVDELSPAELMPGLYRDVLDAVAVLEAAGHRPVADRVRAAAARTYAHAWNQTATRRLRRLRDDARRLSGTRHRARPLRPWHVLRRRPAAGRPV